MKLKDIKTNYSKFNAYLKKEGQNHSTYYDTIKYKVIKDKIVFLVEDPEYFPKELIECEILDFDIEIELDNQNGITSFNNRYRAQNKTLT